MTAGVSTHVRHCLDRHRAGDAAARDELLARAADRLWQLARQLLRADFPRLRRWEETDDVFQNAAWRLYRALADVAPPDSLAFYRLAALQIRRELLDLARRHYGPHGPAAHHTSVRTADPAADTHDPDRLADWTEFHRQVEALPDAERAVADLLWYQRLPQEEAAALLGVDVRTVQRRWQRVRVLAHRWLSGARAGD
jgi:RNA polymerase sigma-70 factor (ECF subfamily)